MEEIYAYLACEPGFLDYLDLKRAKQSIWILGKQFSVENGDLENLDSDINSRIWFTYRKNFPPIGDTGLTSDSGWGCMHRCGQMVLAQTMLMRHFGREWKWKPGETEELYKKILSKFNDMPECSYSIHKIASMDGDLNKKIGQWFGPNTVLHVLRKLAEKDPDNDICIHVAMDNMIIKSEIRKLFRGKPQEPSSSESETSTSCNFPPKIQCNEIESGSKETKDHSHSESERDENPVLVTIPLRLGLSDIITSYFERLKATFEMPQSVGMIGGRTNHASYFIGYVGNELLHLDPHTTQQHISEGPIDDSSYHCASPSRMPFEQLDPSIGLCFYMKDETDFDSWCEEAKKSLLQPEKDALFEILEEKPPMLPYVDFDECEEGAAANDVDHICTSDDEFEFLG